MIDFSRLPHNTALTYSSFAGMDRAETPELLKQSLIELMLACGDARALLSALAELLSQVFRGDVSWAIAQPQSQDGSLAAAKAERDLDPLISEGRLWPWQEDLIARTQDTGQLFAVDDVQASLPDLEFPPTFPVRSLLCLPTYHLGQMNGFVAIAHFQPHQWSLREKYSLTAAAPTLTLAFERLSQQQQVAVYRRHQGLLNRLSEAISNTSDLDSLLNLALAEIGGALAIHRAWLLELKYDNPLFVQRHPQEIPAATATAIADWSPQNTESYVGQSFRLRQGWFCAQAWATLPQPWIVSDRAAIPHQNPLPSPQWIDPSEQQALLVLPLLGRSGSHNSPARILGFLILQHHRPRYWTEAEVELATWVSTQISTATLNHQALQQVRDLVEERTAQLKWSLDVQAKLSEKMRQQIDQLQHLNQLKDEFLDTIQHELKTPLATMKMAIRMLRQPDLNPERQEKYLDILEQEWQREDHLIEDLLALQKLESNQVSLQPQRLDLKSFIRGITEPFLPKWQKKGLTLQTTYSPDEDAIAAYIDPDSLERILAELLTNAGKYATVQTAIQLNIEQQAENEGDRLIVSVTNTGPGIEADDLDNIFEKFHRGKGVTAQAIQGTGLGLALVKSLVNHLDGEIAVSSRPGETCFTVSIPQSQDF
ncbi:MAG: ATP-binding protein [Spirulinaceae cyanobacterium]